MLGHRFDRPGANSADSEGCVALPKGAMSIRWPIACIELHAGATVVWRHAHRAVATKARWLYVADENGESRALIHPTPGDLQNALRWLMGLEPEPLRATGAGEP